MFSMMRTTSRSAVLVIAVVGAAVVTPVAPAVAVEPPPPVVGTGTSGSVLLTPTLAPGETVVPTSLGLGRPAEVVLGEPGQNDGHSGISSEPGSIVAQGQVFIDDEALLRVDIESADPSVSLRTEVVFIEQGELEPSNVATLEGPGTADRFEIGDPFSGLWLVDVYQVSGGAGVPVDVTSTTTTAEAPLTLSPNAVSESDPTITASWSGLSPDSTYLAAVQWGYWRNLTVIEVRTGRSQPVATTTTARLSSSLQLPGMTTTLITSVSSADGGAVIGQLRLRVDGIIRWTKTVNSGDTVFRIPVPRLSAGLHEVKAEFRPADGSHQPSNGPARRLVVL